MYSKKVRVRQEENEKHVKKVADRLAKITKVESWDDAIAYAQGKIQELRRAIKGFKMAKERGDKWLPGSN